jgi:hypothetical protein
MFVPAHAARETGITIMKLSIIALAGALALFSTSAFAQAGEGDAGFSGGGGGGGYALSGHSYGGYGFSRAYGAMIHTGRTGRNAHGGRRSDRRE